MNRREKSMQYAMTNKWGSKRFYSLLLIGQCVTKCLISYVPANAMREGVLGSIICYFTSYIVIGIPVLYMEMVVAQFTSRNCLDVWKIIPCFSHFGYFIIVWQIISLIVNQSYFTYVLYYFLITFDNPIPFYTCGNWSSPDCDILSSNWSVYQDCLINYDSDTAIECSSIFTTYTEWQYWRNFMKADEDMEFTIIWRMLIPLTFLCILQYLCCFRSKLSMRWAMPFLTIGPFVLFFVMFLGTLIQDGVVSKFGEAVDYDFTQFVSNFDVDEYISQIVIANNLGSGLVFNLAGSSDFRSMTYNITVITMVICGLFCSFIILLSTLMICPYAAKLNQSPATIAMSPMVFTFEKVPHLLHEYDAQMVWLLVFYGAFLILGLRVTVIILFNLQEAFAKKFRIVAKYPGIRSVISVVVLFFVTVPCISNYGLNILVATYTRILILIPLLMVAVEISVFVIWYGVGKFSEDIHFMIGIQPKTIIKVAWVVIDVALYCVIYKKLYFLFETFGYDAVDYIGVSFFTLVVFIIIIWTVVKIIAAWFKGGVKQAFKLDPSWGPQNEVLYRSRAMFSAQAMTKEYLYRQYHLQAGILERQRASNTRQNI